MQEKPAVFIYGKVRQPPELMHYGIKGQKWGVRRFQYENGSYTTEGKERYGRGSKKENTGGRHRKAVADLDSIIDSKDPKVRSVYSDKDRKDLIDYRNKLAKKDNIPLRTSGIKTRDKKDPNARENWKVKDVSKLSDDELRKRNNRLNAERNYKESLTPQWKKTAKNWGSEALKAIFVTTLMTVAADAVRTKIQPDVKNAVNSIIDSASKKAVSVLDSSKKTAASYLAAFIMNREVNKR